MGRKKNLDQVMLWLLHQVTMLGSSEMNHMLGLTLWVEKPTPSRLCWRMTRIRESAGSLLSRVCIAGIAVLSSTHKQEIRVIQVLPRSFFGGIGQHYTFSFIRQQNPSSLSQSRRQ